MLLTLRRTVAGSPCLGWHRFRGWDQRCNVKPGLDGKRCCGARSNERATLTCDAWKTTKIKWQCWFWYRNATAAKVQEDPKKKVERSRQQRLGRGNSQRGKLRSILLLVFPCLSLESSTARIRIGFCLKVTCASFPCAEVDVCTQSTVCRKGGQGVFCQKMGKVYLVQSCLLVWTVGCCRIGAAVSCQTKTTMSEIGLGVRLGRTLDKRGQDKTRKGTK